MPARRAWRPDTSREEKRMKIFLKILKGITVGLCAALTALFVVYFWNLDQKLMEWAYRRVNQIFDRKKTDIQF